MTRSVPPWTGKTDDEAPPPRVRARVFLAKGGKCHRCHRLIRPGAGDKWTLEHLIAIANGGANAEPNLDLTCSWCLPAKNAEDVAQKAADYGKRLRHLGLKKAKHPLPGSRASKWKRKIDGTVVLR